MYISSSRDSTLVNEGIHRGLETIGGFEESSAVYASARVSAKIFAILSLSEIKAPVESLNCGFRTDPPRMSRMYF